MKQRFIISVYKYGDNKYFSHTSSPLSPLTRVLPRHKASRKGKIIFSVGKDISMFLNIQDTLQDMMALHQLARNEARRRGIIFVEGLDD